jgi:hypothetical protein
MGLLKHVLFWPVTGPSFLTRFSLRKVEDAVREQLTDDQRVKEELMALQMEYELGDVDDEEYALREADLMRQLREVREWREEFGMGTSGGPVRVRRETQEEPAGQPQDAGADEEERPGGGIASPGGASVELNLDWEED